MEQQQGNPRPPMPPENYGKRMWQLWGPILIKWGIEFLVSLLAMTALAMAYQLTDPAAFRAAMESQEAMFDLYDRLISSYLEAGTLIQGAASLVIIPVMWIFFHQDRVKERRLGIIPNKKAPVWKYAAVILMALALCLGLNNLINIGNLGASDEVYTETMNTLYSAALPVQIIALGILVPISEELVFRGLLFKRLRERGTFLQAALYSAVVFGLMHMNMVQMLYAFILGMMLAYVCEKYGSVKAPILADVQKGEPLKLLEEMDSWSRVVSGSGVIGYIQNRALGEAAEETPESSFEAPVFQHQQLEGKVVLGWHAVFGRAAALDSLDSVCENTKGVMNVICPTGIQIKNAEG